MQIERHSNSERGLIKFRCKVESVRGVWREGDALGVNERHKGTISANHDRHLTLVPPIKVASQINENTHMPQKGSI